MNAVLSLKHDNFSDHARGTSATLRRFTFWWLKNRPIAPPLDSVTHAGEFAGVVLYREEPFQVQLWIGKPNATIPTHSHPHVDTYEAIIAGGAEFVTEKDEWLKSLLRIRDNEPHSGLMSAKGVSFLSFQRWEDGRHLTSIHLDWSGQAFDEQHATELAS